MPASIRRVVHTWTVVAKVMRTCIHCSQSYDQDDNADRRNHHPPCWICGGDWGHTACSH